MRGQDSHDALWTLQHKDADRDVQGSGRGRATWNSRELIRLTSNFLLEDAWVLLPKLRFEATWQRDSSASRIDRFYVPPSLLEEATS